MIKTGKSTPVETPFPLTRRKALATGFAAGASLATGLLPAFPALASPPTNGEMQNFLVFDRELPLPEDPFVDVDGAERRLDDFKGDVLLVNFWATWCAPCIHEMPGLIKLADRFANEPFRFLAISQDRGGASTALTFARDRLNLSDDRVFFDERLMVGRGLRVRGLPTTLIIDADGRVVGVLEGLAEWDTPDAAALVEYVLENGAPSASQS